MLKFYAKSDQLVRVPGAQPRPNQPDMYVGRNFDSTSRGYPATKEGHEVEENTDSGRRLTRLVQIDQCLWPADKDTARACCVEFIAVEFKDGSFVEKSKQSPKQLTES